MFAISLFFFLLLCCWNLSLHSCHYLSTMMFSLFFCTFFFCYFDFFSSIVRSVSQWLVPNMCILVVCVCFISFYHLKLFVPLCSVLYCLVLFCLFTLIWRNISKANQHRWYTIRYEHYGFLITVRHGKYNNEYRHTHIRIRIQRSLSRAHTHRENRKFEKLHNKNWHNATGYI